jgi:hypothetical protein
VIVSNPVFERDDHGAMLGRVDARLVLVPEAGLRAAAVQLEL